MKTINFAQYTCRVVILKYNNERPAIQIVDAKDETPILTASINMPEVMLGANEVIIKDYSENAGILDVLIKEGYIAKTGKTIPVGQTYCEICKVIPM